MYLVSVNVPEADRLRMVSPQQVFPYTEHFVNGEDLPMLLLGFGVSVLAWLVCSTYCYGTF